METWSERFMVASPQQQCQRRDELDHRYTSRYLCVVTDLVVASTGTTIAAIDLVTLRENVTCEHHGSRTATAGVSSFNMCLVELTLATVQC